MFTKDITLVKKTTSGYVCYSLKGFWSTNESLSTNGTDLELNKSLTCRILLSEPNVDKIKKDDYLVKGVVSSVTTITSLTDYFKVSSISKKDYGSSSMQHVEIS